MARQEKFADLCISQFQTFRKMVIPPQQIFKNCQILAPKENFLVKSQGAGLPSDTLF